MTAARHGHPLVLEMERSLEARDERAAQRGAAARTAEGGAAPASVHRGAGAAGLRPLGRQVVVRQQEVGEISVRLVLSFIPSIPFLPVPFSPSSLLPRGGEERGDC